METKGNAVPIAASAVWITGLVSAFWILNIVVRAAVLATLWRWFVVPQFGLAPLSVAMACGLLTVLEAATPAPMPLSREPAEQPKSTPRTALLRFVMLMVQPLLALAAGWVFVQLL